MIFAVKTETWLRKTFYVEAVRVTKENISEVAEFCGGVVENTDGTPFVRVPNQNPANERQTQAYPGDWVLVRGDSVKSFPNKAFRRNFMPDRKTPLATSTDEMLLRELNTKQS